MTEFYPQRGFALDAALSAISGRISLVRTRRNFTCANTAEFHLCEHGGFFAVAAKIINQMSGLERKFYNAITLKFRRSLN